MIERCVLWILVFLVFSCSPKKHENKTVRDDLDREVEWSGQSYKIVSLAPSVTEVLYFLGLNDKLVAVSESCDFPEDVHSKEKIKAYPYTDIEKLVKLKPDVVLTYEGLMPDNDIEKLKSLEIPVYSVSFKNVEDVFSGMKSLAQLLSAEEQSMLKVDSLQAVYNGAVSELESKSVVCLISAQPMYAYGKGTLVTENIQKLGAENVINEQFTESFPVISEEFLLKHQPEVFIFSSFENKMEEFFDIHPLLKELEAYKKGNTFIINPDNASRPGPRVVQNLIDLKNTLEKAQ